MDLFLIILAFLLLALALLGCVLPMLPGPPLAFIGMLLVHWSGRGDFTWTEFLIVLLLVIVSQVLDYITPMLGTKYSGGSKEANRGSLIGTIVGLFFLPVGIILGPFIGAIAGAMLSGSDFSRALKAGIGSLIGFLFGTMLKFIVCAYVIYLCIVEVA